MANKNEALKEQILAMIAVGNDPKELAKEYGISGRTIGNWRRGSKDPKVKPPTKTEQDEIKELKQRIMRLEMERDVLKKAMAIISTN